MIECGGCAPPIIAEDAHRDVSDAIMLLGKKHREAIEAITYQGPCEASAALDNLEGAVKQVREMIGGDNMPQKLPNINCQCYRHGKCLHHAAPRRIIGKPMCVLLDAPEDPRIKPGCVLQNKYPRPNAPPPPPPGDE